MGSFIEINDTLRITKAQGFPAQLDITRHLEKPYILADVAGKTYSFSGKPAIRIYKIPPVRNFLAEEIDGKWLYWGRIFVTEVTHDYEKGETAGKFKIISLNTPDEMKAMFALTDGRPELDYFA